MQAHPFLCVRGLGVLLALAGVAGANDLSGPISDDTTGPLLSGQVYHLTGTVNVPAGKTLTIQEDVIVKGYAGVQFVVYGTLVADATPALPITITSILDDTAGGDTNGDGPSSGAPGDWRGMLFYADSDASVLDHVEVRYAGFASWAGIDLNDADVLLSNCTIRDCLADGLDLGSSTEGVVVSGCSFVGNGSLAVGNVPLSGVPGFTGNSASGNTMGDFMEITSYGSSTDLSIVADDCLNGALVIVPTLTLADASTLTLGPDVVLKFKAGLQLLVRGTLHAQGAAGQPVVFTSFQDDDHAGDTNKDGAADPGAPGQWRGLVFYASAAASSLTESTVRYAGFASWAGIHLVDTPLTMSGTTVRDCLADGVSLNNASVGVLVDDCEFVDNGQVALGNAPLSAVPGFSGNAASGNGVGDYVEVSTYGPSTDISIVADDCMNGALVIVPNLTVAEGSTLSLGQDVVLKFGAGVQLVVRGTLETLGTPLQQVVFTSLQDDDHAGDTNKDAALDPGAPGQWRGLYFHATAGTSTLDGAVVRYAGYASWAGIHLADTPLVLTACTVRDCLADGLSLSDGSTGISVAGCLFEDNGQVAVGNVPLDAVPGFTGNSASGNAAGNFMEITSSSPTVDVTIVPDNCLEGALVFLSVCTVPSGVTLTVAPGVVIKFKAGLYINVNGALELSGDLESTAVFTSFWDDAFAGDTDLGGPAAAPGDWRGVLIGVGADAFTISGALLRYSGFASWPALQCSSPLVNVRHTRVEYAQADGFRIDDALEARHLVAYANGLRGLEVNGGGFDLARVTSVLNGAEGIHAAVAHTGEVVDSISWSNGGDNFSGFALGEIRYCDGDPAAAGSDGNIDAPPRFEGKQAGALTLKPSSPCVNAGDPLSPLDPDTTRADMGAYYLDHCLARPYCASKVTAIGYVPEIGATGKATLTGADDFHVIASDVPGGTTAVLLWGLAENPPGVGGGNLAIGPSPRGVRLCVAGVQQLETVVAGGTIGVCDGTLDVHVTQSWMGGEGLLPGTTLYVQFVFDDPGHPDGSGLGHTDALRFAVCP